MPDLHARLLVEIERREDETVPHLPSPHAVSRELAYLAAFREIVRLHDGPHQCWDSEGTVTIMDDDCETQLIIASALGVEA